MCSSSMNYIYNVNFMAYKFTSQSKETSFDPRFVCGLDSLSCISRLLTRCEFSTAHCSEFLLKKKPFALW